ncbi:MAG TPA: type II toxin-antitoxin system RelE/ParE family toxin [Amaricoccus sp.]|nr:type II toxin-antitoxin system RelE/ParE family toxin [Amaricoccus sp.]
MKIIRTTRYRQDLKRMGVTASEVQALEQSVAGDPLAGDLTKGLGGIRKVRFGFGGRGKRGGGRAIYFLMVADDAVAMLFAYAKNEQEDLTPAQRKEALRIMREIME